MNTRRVAAAAVLFLTLSAGGAWPKEAPQLTPLELQALQSRQFETTKDIAFASVMSVFQDLGYIIESADVGTGFITAKSNATTKTDWIFTGNKYSSATRATAFVEAMPGRASRIRLNFVTATQTSSSYGQNNEKAAAILDPAVYQNAFEKVETAVFVRDGQNNQVASASAAGTPLATAVSPTPPAAAPK